MRYFSYMFHVHHNSNKYAFICNKKKSIHKALQARRQDNVTGWGGGGGGAEINFWGHEKFIYVKLSGAGGQEKFIPVWIKRTR